MIEFCFFALFQRRERKTTELESSDIPKINWTFQRQNMVIEISESFGEDQFDPLEELGIIFFFFLTLSEKLRKDIMICSTQSHQRRSTRVKTLRLSRQLHRRLATKLAMSSSESSTLT